MITGGVKVQDLPYRDMEKLRQVSSRLRAAAAGNGAAAKIPSCPSELMATKETSDECLGVMVLVSQSPRQQLTRVDWVQLCTAFPPIIWAASVFVLLLTELHLCFQVRRDLIKAIPLMLISLPPFANYLVFVLMWVTVFFIWIRPPDWPFSDLPLTLLSQVLLPPADPDPSFLESQTAGGVSRGVPLSPSSAPPARHRSAAEREPPYQRPGTPQPPAGLVH